jgi:HlyD family secretion protein
MKRKSVVVGLLVVIALAVTVGAYYRYRSNGEEPQVTTMPIGRGDVLDTVGATGALEAVTTVQVGTQVSGTIQALYADFNSIVRKGQVIARLDPSLFNTQIEQARANLIRAEADVERLRVGLDDATSKLKRAEGLAARQLISASDFEAAQVNVRAAEAQLRSSQAQVTQARASMNQNQVNLQHTVIEAPIDGIVISRNVDVGQTVAASMQAPTLFVIAADLTKMQVNASIDEADVGRLRPNQPVRFRVDAYPTEEFIGHVVQVRLQPVTVQNVVTYATVIEVPNPDLKLKPGMTANVTIEIARRDDVLRVPNAALRFRPTADVFAALGQQMPPEMQRGGRGDMAGRGGQGGPQAAPAAQGATTAKPAGTTPAGQGFSRANQGSGNSATRPGTAEGVSRTESGRRVGGGDDPERRQRFMERMKTMSPEERERFTARMRERGGSSAGGPDQGQERGAPSRAETAPSSRPTGQTIDSLFGPLPVTESSGRAWLYENRQLKMLRLRLGISDGSFTEIISGDAKEGMPVVTSVTLPGQTTRTGPGAASSPLMGPQRGPGGPGGFRNAPQGGQGGGQRR